MFKKFIALSCRETHESRYFEPRDAISRDWYSYLEALFPEHGIFLLPNTPKRCRDHLMSLPLAGLILSGGNDLGESLERDQTEYQALEVAVQLKIPVMGVCRGAQLIQKAMGGNLTELKSSALHVATEHEVRLIHSPLPNQNDVISKLRVNSFHSKGIALNDLALPLKPFATIRDDYGETVEGFINRDLRVLGMMWHPERPSPNHDWKKACFKTWFSESSRS